MADRNHSGGITKKVCRWVRRLICIGKEGHEAPRTNTAPGGSGQPKPKD